MFRHRQQLRRWAARALFVWLFGIATGVVQACLAPTPVELGGRQAEPAVAVGAQHGKAEAPGRASHHESPAAKDEGVLGHDDSLGKSNCRDFCEKSAVAIPKLKFDLDKVQGHALPPAGVATVCIVPSAEPAQPLLRRDGARAPPIRLAFLRLAL